MYMAIWTEVIYRCICIYLLKDWSNTRTESVASEAVHSRWSMRCFSNPTRWTKVFGEKFPLITPCDTDFFAEVGLIASITHVLQICRDVYNSTPVPYPTSMAQEAICWSGDSFRLFNSQPRCVAADPHCFAAVPHAWTATDAVLKNFRCLGIARPIEVAEWTFESCLGA